MFYYFKKGKNSTKIQRKNICAMYGEGAITDQMYQKWFAVSCWRFLAGRCSMAG